MFQLTEPDSSIKKFSKTTDRGLNWLFWVELQGLLLKPLVEKEVESTVKDSEADSGRAIYKWSSYWRGITNHLMVCVDLEAAVKKPNS